MALIIPKVGDRVEITLQWVATYLVIGEKGIVIEDVSGRGGTQVRWDNCSKYLGTCKPNHTPCTFFDTHQLFHTYVKVIDEEPIEIVPFKDRFELIFE